MSNSALCIGGNDTILVGKFDLIIHILYKCNVKDPFAFFSISFHEDEYR